MGTGLRISFLSPERRRQANREGRLDSVLQKEVRVHSFRENFEDLSPSTFLPEPSSSALATTRGAGPAFVPEGSGTRLNWVVDLEPRASVAALRNVSRVVLQEVSGKQPVNLFNGPPERTDNGLLVVGAGELISRFSYPWLYTADRTIVVLRLELIRPGAKSDVLLQPVLIGPEVKKQLKDGGYLP